MCLTIPMQVTQLSGLEAICAAKGVERAVSLVMMQGKDAAIGDWVLVHLGRALQVISEREARETWEILDQLLIEDEAVA
jgi:hydrogenase expression/formation protein HypC